jgi:hypothetical protein
LIPTIPPLHTPSMSTSSTNINKLDLNNFQTTNKLMPINQVNSNNNLTVQDDQLLHSIANNHSTKNSAYQINTSNSPKVCLCVLIIIPKYVVI